MERKKKKTSMFRFGELFDIVQALVFICTHLILGIVALNSKSSKRKLICPQKYGYSHSDLSQD